MFQTKKKLTIIEEENDNRLLELAIASSADYLVTGNHNDFTMTVFGNTKIVSPKEYWEIYR